MTAAVQYFDLLENIAARKNNFEQVYFLQGF